MVDFFVVNNIHFSKTSAKMFVVEFLSVEKPKVLACTCIQGHFAVLSRGAYYSHDVFIDEKNKHQMV